MKFPRLNGARLGAATSFVVLFMVVSLATRIALAAQAARAGGLDLGGLAAAFGWGTLFDLGAAGLWSLPLVLAWTLLPGRWFAGCAAHAIVSIGTAVVLFALLFVALAEWFFWDEFSARFNFIAVDYLVYTQEVLGNIRESYPMGWLMSALGVLALAGAYLVARCGWIGRWLRAAGRPVPAGDRWLTALLWTLVVAGLATVLSEDRLPSWENNYERELAKNGPWAFVAAFRSNWIDYDHFYRRLPLEEALARTKARIGGGESGAVPGGAPDGRDLARCVPAPRPAEPEARWNVVQITVESLSARFLSRYGNTDGLTPNLDALCTRSLVFDRFYATGTRTDRGMEALTLSVPPTPGRSLVKRPGSENLFTLGAVFRTRGYDTAFIYGGRGFFDNMNAFFGGNGYRVVDRGAFSAEEVTFENAWGACDEDLFARALREADAQHAAGRPFFQFLMTTSNHRPFTYPEGRIDLPSGRSRRSGGVKYTDYAIGRFLREAEGRPWFANTIFVVVADHCASSAGKAALEVEGYHVPLIIFAPGGQVPPGVVDTLCGQMDYAPTLLGLLNWSYPSRFFGRNVLAQPEIGMAWLGNYQKLGLYDGRRLAVLWPVRRAAVFEVDARGKTLADAPGSEASELLETAVATYQSAGWLIKNKRQGDEILR